jgi:hypothetical protein
MEATTAGRAAWQACRARQRCARVADGVTGADVVRISRTLAVEPWHFTQAAPAAVGDPGGIVLDKGRRRVTLTLATAAHGCVFLVRTASGATCCGLGDLAPVSCRLFPIDPATGDAPATGDVPEAGCATGDAPAAGCAAGGSASGESLTAGAVIPDAASGEPMPGHSSACRCRAQPGAHLDERQGWAADQGHWHETVARWNRQFGNASAAATGIEDFQRYLMEAQAAREAGAGWPEEVGV